MSAVKAEPVVNLEADGGDDEEDIRLDPKSVAAQRHVWLVKIPNEVYDVWKNANDTDCLATVRLYGDPGAPPRKVTMHLEENAAYPEKAARDYSMACSDTTAQGMLVLGETTEAPVRRSLRGIVTSRASAMPQTDKRYRSLLNERHAKHSQRTATQIVDQDDAKRTRNVIHTFKVTEIGPPGQKPVKPTKDDLIKDKRVRVDRGELETLIFKAFEGHQYYFLKDLVKRTDQPMAWVKEVLKDLCVYHQKGKYKNMYELKKEYQTFEYAPETAVGGGDDDDDLGLDSDDG